MDAGIPITALFLMTLLLAALLVEPLVRRLRLPFATALVVAGFLGSELLVRQGIDTGLRWYHFQNLIFYGLLPVLVFEAAFNIDARALLKNAAPILMLAVPAMLLGTGVTAVLVFYGIGHPTGFPWIAALITGAILAATDPTTVIDALESGHGSPRLKTVIEGESLVNGTTVILLVAVLIGVARGEAPGVGGAVIQFLVLFLGGLGVGAVVGGLAVGFTRLFPRSRLRALITLLAAWFAFLIAEGGLHVSGIMAVLATGLVLGEADRRQALDDDRFVHRVWDLIAYVAGSMSFLLMGVTFTVAMFTQRWLAMLIGIAAVLIARGIGVVAVAPLLPHLPGRLELPAAQQRVVIWGGLRGAVALALALSLPVELDYWWTIQSIVYGVVLFNLLVQAPTMVMFVRRLNNT